MLVWLVIGLFAVVLVQVAVRYTSKRRSERRTTSHSYYVSAPKAELPLDALTRRLKVRGYRLSVQREPWAVFLRDERAKGRVTLTVGEGGPTFAAELTAEDDGPGFYDELAQFAILELSALLPDLRFGPSGESLRPASELAGELPERPYGVA